MTDSKTGILMYNMSVKDTAVLESKKMLKNQKDENKPKTYRNHLKEFPMVKTGTPQETN